MIILCHLGYSLDIFVFFLEYAEIKIVVRWWTSETVAVVTGANRGIGFEMVKQLAGHGLTVILTSRDENVGVEAAKVLQEGGFNVDFHRLDILDTSSIQDFCQWIKEKYGFIDVLVSLIYYNIFTLVS